MEALGKIKFFFILYFIVFIASSCQQLKYEADLGFLNSAQANSMEYLAVINGKVCKDIDGMVGLCAKRISSNEDLNFSFEARPYAYRLDVRCSATIDFDFSVDVQKDKSYSFKIQSSKYGNERSFTCIGEIFPEDRDQQVSATFSIRVVIKDALYRGREEIYQEGSVVVLGKNAKYAKVDGKEFSKSPIVKLKKFAQAYSESERMRFNYAGY